MAAKWEQGTHARLIELRNSGHSIDAIGEQIGRTPLAVQSQACKLRLRRQPGDRSRYAPITAEGKLYRTATDDDRLRFLMRDQVGWEEAARRLGRTVSSTQTRWKRLSKPASPRVYVAPAPQTRNCMRCRGMFSFEHRGNRLCVPCGHYAVGTRSQYD